MSVVTLCLITLVAVFLIYGDEVFDFSNTHISENLMKIRNLPLSLICIIFSNFVNPYLIFGILMVMLFVAKEKWKFFNFLFFYSIANYIIGVLKSAFHEPRPYFVDENLVPLE